jgi:hypothetical protein
MFLKNTLRIYEILKQSCKRLYVRLSSNYKVVLLTLEVGLLILHYLIPFSAEYLLIRFPLGVICYILIPGFLLSSILVNHCHHDLTGFAFLFGFSLQALVIATFWTFNIETADLRLVIMLLTAIVVLLMLLRSPKELLGRSNWSYKSGAFLVLILAISVRLSYLFISGSSLGIDGGLYCDFARTIVTQGRFSSHILNDGFSDPFYNAEGFTPYPLTVSSIAVLFLIGDVSYTSARLMVSIVGILLVFFVYEISQDLFGKKVALIAGLISAFSPLLSYYSSILNGPEILASMFALAAFYFFTRGLREREHEMRYITLSGLFTAMVEGAHGTTDFVVLLAALALVIVVYRVRGWKEFLYTLSSIGALFFAYMFADFLFIYVLLVIVMFAALFLSGRCKDRYYFLLSSFTVAVISFMQLFFVRGYLFPEAYIIPASQAFLSNPIASVVGSLSLGSRINTDINYILRTCVLLCESLTIVLTPLLFGLSLLSFASLTKLRQKIAVLILPLSSSILVIGIPAVLVWSGEGFPDRLLISPVAFLIILSAVTIDELLKKVGDKRSSASFTERGLRTHPWRYKMRKNYSTLIVAAIVFISLVPSQVYYLNNLNSGYTNVLQWYGSSSIRWIETNSSPNSVFLAADPRRLAWLTDRTFVGTTTESGVLNATELANLIGKFNVSYLIVEDFLILYVPHSSIFDELYSGPLQLGQTYLIVQEGTIEEILNDLVIQSNTSYVIKDVLSIRLVFESSIDTRNIRIFQVVNSDYSM